MEIVPISEEYPLGETVHFVGACRMIETAVAGEAGVFEAFYASLQVACMAIVVDGDCGLDVMCMMLGQPQTLAARV